MSGAYLNGRLHCMLEQCKHAKPCPLTTLKNDQIDPFWPEITARDGTSYLCTSYSAKQPRSPNEPADRSRDRESINGRST